MITLYKTGTYSIMHISVAFAVAFAVTGNLAAAVAISLIEPAVQTIFYFFHEKIWNKIEENKLATQKEKFS
jgi:uncharacterized membrane protein